MMRGAFIPRLAARCFWGLGAFLLFAGADLRVALAATVLSYHGFDHSGRATSITPEAFEDQLRFLTENGYNVISLKDLAGYIDRREPFPPKTVAIAIDDGWRTIMRGAALLEKYDLPFTLFLPMQYMENPASRLTLSREDIDTLRANPKASFADHSYSHSPKLKGPNIARGGVSKAFIENDIAKSKKRYEEIFGGQTPFFAYPFGRGAKAYAEALNKAGFVYLFTVGGASFDEKVDRNAIPRLGGHRLSVKQLERLIR